MHGMPNATRRSKKPPTLRQVFAENVRVVRTNRGLSQERLADEAGLDRTFVSSLERGVRNISIDNIERIALALDTPAHDLLDAGLAAREDLDSTLLRAPRSARPFPAARRTRAASKP
jgi:transcriptional regulator with XRE-family HTH domain